MSHSNAAEVNVKCEKTMTSLLDLNDFAMLHVFGYLNLMDSINFAGTSKRLKGVGALHFTKYKHFHLIRYKWSKQPNRLPVETVLSHIGRHIETLSTYPDMQAPMLKAVVDNCVNVTALNLYDFANASELINWMEQLKLESLLIDCHIQLKEMRWMAALKELQFTGCNAVLTNILEKTAELEVLTVDLHRNRDFNYANFIKIPNLKCLDIEIDSVELAKLTEFLKMDVLTQFKVWVYSNSDTEGLQQLNSFLQILAERNRLSELKLVTDTVDQNTFRILQSFHHLTSFGFEARNYVDHRWDERWMIHQLANAQPNLKHLDFMLKNLLIEHVDLVVKNLVKLETFRFEMSAKDLEQLDELRINEMLKTSTSRPMLTLHINSTIWSDAAKIELRFEQRKHRIVQWGRNYADDSYFLTDEFYG